MLKQDLKTNKRIKEDVNKTIEKKQISEIRFSVCNITLLILINEL
jgi:hypothetical protein